MGLTLDNWNMLSEEEKINVVNFLRDNCRIDREIPSSQQNRPNAYVIQDGITSGGHRMKFGDQYRIYISDISGIPDFLDLELKERGTKNRIGGTAAIREIMDFGGFRIGRN